jgi:hypothetical protein
LFLLRELPSVPMPYLMGQNHPKQPEIAAS